MNTTLAKSPTEIDIHNVVERVASVTQQRAVFSLGFVLCAPLFPLVSSKIVQDIRRLRFNAVRNYKTGDVRRELIQQISVYIQDDLEEEIRRSEMLRARLRNRLRKFITADIIVDRPIFSLYDLIRDNKEKIQESNLVNVFGLERSLNVLQPSFLLPQLDHEVHMLRSAVQRHLLIWLPETALDLVARGAREFWANRSSVYELRVNVANRHRVTGTQLIEEGAWQRGIDLLRNALRIYREIGSDKGASDTYLLIGDVQQRFGDYELARMTYGDAERHFRRIGDDTGEMLARLKKGTVELQLQNIPSARAHIEAASQYFHRVYDGEQALLSDKWLDLARQMEQAAREVAA